MTEARRLLLGPRAAAPALFVAIPTGQVAANLLPLFELAEPGDIVLWLATPEAARQGWLARSQAVVERRHPAMRQIVFGDLAETLDLWRDTAKTVRQSFDGLNPVYLLNGGTKLMNFAVAEIFRRAGMGRMPVAYAAPPPVPQLVLQPEGPGGPTYRRDWRSGRHLTLDEVLAAYGFRRLRSGQPAGPLWRAGGSVPAPPAPDDPYGEDPDISRRAQAAAHSWANRDRLARADPPTFAEAGFDAETQRQLLAAVRQFQTAGAGPAQLEQLFNLFRRRMLDAEVRRRIRAENEITGGSEGRPPLPLGQRFERAVARRVLGIVAREEGLRKRLAEVWTNVVLEEEASPGKASVEIDILFLTRHATALILECKSGFAGPAGGNAPPGEDALGKDIHARAWRLQRACGSFARVAVTLPLYCAPGTAEWQDDLLDRWRSSIHGRQETLFFTLPGHATSSVIATDGAEVQVPSFETALADWLGRI